MSITHAQAQQSTRIAAGVELLATMLDTESVSGGEARLAHLLASHLRNAGFDTRIDAVGNLIAIWGDGVDHVALVGHLDTVPGRIAVRTEDGRLHGRGAVDAKGPLAAALTAVMRQPRDAGRRFTVVGAVEEETTSRGALHVAEKLRAPANLVILEPSGWDGITIAYKGSIRLRWTVEVPASHSAGPQPSAADQAFAYVSSLHELARARSNGARHFDRVDLRVIRCEAGGDGLCDRARVECGLRLPLGCDVAVLIRDVHALAGAGRVEIVSAEPAVRTDRGSPLARRFVSAIRAHGGAPRFKLKTGTSDLNVLAPAWGCPALAYGPGNSLLDHTPDEYVEISEFERAVDVFDTVLRTL